MDANEKRPPRSLSPSSEIIEEKGERITPAWVASFRAATHAAHGSGVPPTFATILRRSEFQWLEKLSLELRNLLHTEQEYTYLEPLVEGDTPVARTRLTESRERRGLLFLTLESEIVCGEKTKVIARSGFVIRNREGA